MGKSNKTKVASKTKRSIKLSGETADFINSCGKSAREVYLNDNPHGFSQVCKKHKSKKSYTRKKKHKKNLDY